MKEIVVSFFFCLRGKKMRKGLLRFHSMGDLIVV